MRRKQVVAHISRELRSKLKSKRRSLLLRKGDKVKVMRGDYKGVSGEVVRIDLKKMVAFVDKVKVKKSDGKEKNVPISASNLTITEMKEDKKRSI